MLFILKRIKMFRFPSPTDPTFWQSEPGFYVNTDKQSVENVTKA